MTVNLADVFSFFDLTEAINKIEPKPTKVSRLKLFEPQFLTTRVVRIEEQEGTLQLLQVAPWGSPPDVNTRKVRRVRALIVPHIPVMDVALPGDVQDVREFGTNDRLASLTRIVNDRLVALKDRIETTLEFMMLGALKGVVKDGAGTVVCDLFSEFGVQQNVISFALTNTNTKVVTKCKEAIRKIEENLLGAVATGYHAFCSPSFMDKLITHPSVEQAFLGWSAATTLAQEYKVFNFGGIAWEEYNYNFVTPDGTKVAAIEENTAYIFPIAPSLFKLYFAPGDFNEAVNTVAVSYYAKIQERPWGKGYDIYAESNPLPICLRPSVLIKATV